MRTETVTYDATLNLIIAVVRSHNRRTTTIENEYRRMLYIAYPEVDKLMKATLAVKPPKRVLSKDMDGVPVLIDDPDDSARYNDQINQIAYDYPDANDLYKFIETFVPLAARLTSLIGTDFSPNDHQRFEQKSLVQAFEDYLEEDDRGECLWGKVKATLDLMDKPNTPPEQRPKEALTEAEQADPLSTNVTKIGKSA